MAMNFPLSKQNVQATPTSAQPAGSQVNLPSKTAPEIAAPARRIDATPKTLAKCNPNSLR
jgi:hypothetical protein